MFLSEEKIVEKLKDLDFEINKNFVYCSEYTDYFRFFSLGNMFAKNFILAIDEKKIFIARLNIACDDFSKKIPPIILERQNSEILFKKGLFFYNKLSVINKKNPREKIEFRLPKFILLCKFHLENMKNIYKDVNKIDY